MQEKRIKKHTAMTQNQIIQTVQNRATELMQEPKIQKIMMEFKSKDEAETWLLKSALATLIIPVNKRRAQL